MDRTPRHHRPAVRRCNPLVTGESTVSVELTRRTIPTPLSMCVAPCLNAGGNHTPRADPTAASVPNFYTQFADTIEGHPARRKLDSPHYTGDEFPDRHARAANLNEAKPARVLRAAHPHADRCGRRGLVHSLPRRPLGARAHAARQLRPPAPLPLRRAPHPQADELSHLREHLDHYRARSPPATREPLERGPRTRRPDQEDGPTHQGQAASTP